MQVALHDLAARAGQELGYSSWHEITREQVRAFADATGDHQWLHVDDVRAQAGPYGTTIAHGFLTLALTPLLLRETVQVEGCAAVVNYGVDRVRFPAAVRVGSRVRARVELLRSDEIAGGVQVVWKLTYEIEGGDKPACVAEVVFRYLAA